MTEPFVIARLRTEKVGPVFDANFLPTRRVLCRFYTQQVTPLNQKRWSLNRFWTLFDFGFKVVRHEEPQRFIKACNAGFQHAKGDYIVLLNNDTEVTGGWLDELKQAFTRFDKVGAVGSKLLYPDGTLQAAGGIVE